MNSLHHSTAGSSVADFFIPKFSHFISILEQKPDIHWTNQNDSILQWSNFGSYMTSQTFFLVFCLNEGSRCKIVKLTHFTGSCAALQYYMNRLPFFSAMKCFFFSLRQSAHCLCFKILGSVGFLSLFSPTNPVLDLKILLRLLMTWINI